MKGSIWAAAAFCCVASVSALLTSCDKNPLIIPWNATVRVNTAALYEKLEMTDYMAGLLAENDYMKVTDSVLVYDQQGKLVDKRGIESTDLKTVYIDLASLSKGTYTLVAWQTVSRGYDPWWWLADADQLATARIVQTYPSTISGQYAIGLGTTTLTIGSEAPLIDLELEPMGSVVDISVDGLTPECDYNYASLVIWSEEPRVEGFCLDPARSGEDRWIYSDTRKESDLSFGGISPSSPKRTDFTLSHGGKKRVRLYGTDKTTKERQLISSADISLNPGTHATFYFDFDRISFQPPYTGLTAEFAAWKAKRDAGYLVSDPCVEWGADYQTVRNRVESRMWWRAANDDLEQDENGWFRYYTAAKRLYEVYYFAEAGGKDLFRVFVFTSDDKVPLSVAWNHIELQGYEYKGILPHPDEEELGMCYLYLSPDEKTEVLLLEYGAGGWEIFYMPTDPEDVARVEPVFG